MRQLIQIYSHLFQRVTNAGSISTGMQTEQLQEIFHIKPGHNLLTIFAAKHAMRSAHKLELSMLSGL